MAIKEIQTQDFSLVTPTPLYGGKVGAHKGRTNQHPGILDVISPHPQIHPGKDEKTDF